MVTFEVRDMTCGHCVSSITKAARATDPSAQVIADLATHQVRIGPTGSNSGKLSATLPEAGYTPVLVDGGAVSTQRAAARSGCCCR